MGYNADGSYKYPVRLIDLNKYKGYTPVPYKPSALDFPCVDLPTPEKHDLESHDLPLLDFFINPTRSGIVELQAAAMTKLVKDYLDEMSEETFFKVLEI